MVIFLNHSDTCTCTFVALKHIVQTVNVFTEYVMNYTVTYILVFQLWLMLIVYLQL